ncbi:DUF427 domain-containing protein [Acidipila sp. EB88]|uniref:DUF427 domain-containing protein n=1 Tax=Acidipila sp. EB88 TaxID=2305226 RepID=UPI000F5E0D92|nr:DUF427 domain-containing protein [Acidipila sp. EB88]RRA49223.1 DUF427 domain-containing protein [Acidipila sp. EB88]
MAQPPIESVWDYPRPPRLETTPQRIRVLHAGHTIADTATSVQPALRILETSHPPVYYLPRAAVDLSLLTASGARQSFCEFKGLATYWSLTIPGYASPDLAWSYEAPTAAYSALRGHLAFYASRVDQCWVDDERVVPQPGDFYGGWITSNLRGPFKGDPGTLHW